MPRKTQSKRDRLFIQARKLRVARRFDVKIRKHKKVVFGGGNRFVAEWVMTYDATPLRDIRRMIKRAGQKPCC